MHISHDLLHEIAATFRPQGASLQGQHRSVPRVKVDGQISIIPGAVADAPPVRVNLCDLSSAGLRFLYPSKLKLDGQVVALFNTASGREVALLCTIAYYEPLGEELFAIGAKFVGAVDMESVRRMAS